MAACQGLGGTGTRYTFGQLEALWINNGGSKAVAPVAAAIALAESGGCSTALNPTDNGGTQSSFGLWQISNGTHQAPAADPYDANVNAKLAVAKWTNAGGFSPWGTYNSGAYKSFLSGAAPVDTGVPAAAQTTSFWTDVTTPFAAVAQSLGSVITSPQDIATSVTRLSKDFNSLVGLLNTFLSDIEWLFVPSHWIRIFCFAFGIGALIPGVWALMRVGAGQQGDITLALGILLITFAGVLLFIAFHNLPVSIVDLGGLLGYIAQGIQTGKGTQGPGLSTQLGGPSLFAPGAASSAASAAQNALG
jgi:Lysozyme like domain